MQKIWWNDNDAVSKVMYVSFIIVLTASVFSVAIIPINSADFWWHLKTGEYILQTHELPEQDPFTYTSLSDDPEYPGRPNLILKGYWLSQLLFAVIVNAFGLEGIIIFRGLLFVSIAICIICFIRLCSNSQASLIPLILFALATKVAVEDSDRPQMFIFLFSFVAVLICEWALRKRNNLLLYLNIPLMLIASNMHPGYIVGIVYLIIYVACSRFEERLKPARRSLVISSFLAVLITYLNPNHWNVMGVLSAFYKEGGIMTATIMEHRSPFIILPHITSDPGWLAYWMLIVLSLPAVLFLFVKKRYTWGILLLGVTGASLWSMRYIYFFVPLSTVFITLFMQEVVFSKIKFTRIIEPALLTALVLFLIAKPLHENNIGLKSVLYDMTFPVSAADFMARENLPQPVFNSFEYGGYLEWKLWPKYKMFIDTRELISSVYYRYLEIMDYTPRGRDYLEEYRVALVITPAIYPLSGKMIPLVRGLFHDPKWSVIYLDGQSIMFARKGLYSKELPKYSVYYEVLYEILYWQPFYPRVKAYEQTRVEALSNIGLN